MTTRRTLLSAIALRRQQEQAVIMGRGMRRLPVEERGLGAALLTAVLALLLTSVALARPEEARREERSAVPRAACTSVQVEGSTGAVSVRGVAGDSIVVRAVLTARGKDAQAARELLAGVRLGVAAKGGRVLVRLERRESQKGEPGRGWLAALFGRCCDDIQAEFDVLVPAELAVAVDQTSGRVEITGVRGRVAVDATSGEVEVARGGAVAVDVTSGSARLRDLQGPIEFDGTSGRLDLAGCQGALRVDVTSGDVAIRDLRGDVSIDGTSCAARLSGVSGNVTFDAVGGSLALADFEGSLDMDTASGGLDFEGSVPARGHVRARTVSGDLRLVLRDLRDAALRLRSEHGRVDPGAFARALRPAQGNQVVGTVGKGTAVDIELHSTSGDITLAER